MAKVCSLYSQLRKQKFNLIQSKMRKLRFIKGELKLRFRVVKNVFLFRNGYENVLREFLIEVSSLGLIGFKIK